MVIMCTGGNGEKVKLAINDKMLFHVMIFHVVAKVLLGGCNANHLVAGVLLLSCDEQLCI